MADEGPEADRAALRGLGAALGGAHRRSAPLSGAIRPPSRPQRALPLPAFFFFSSADERGRGGWRGRDEAPALRPYPLLGSHGKRKTV